MAIRRAMTVMVALIVSATFAVSGAAAQTAPKQDNKKRSKQENQEIEQVVKAIDAVMAGQPAPSDVSMSIEPYFMKSQDKKAFVPFVLDVKNAPKTDVVMVLRVVDPAKQPDAKSKKVQYPWEDVHFVPSAQLAGDPAKLNRVFMADAGTYDLYVAIKERTPERAPRDFKPKMGILKTSVTVPDFYGGELTTSTLLVSDKVNELTAPLGPDEARERPFVFGPVELLPAVDREFKKSEQLNIIFQIYNFGLDSAGKPSIVIECEFHQQDGTAEKFFNRISPKAQNASNLPPQFDPAIYPVPADIGIPLTTFPEGNYRAAIKVTDKVSGKVLEREVKFTVKG